MRYLDHTNPTSVNRAIRILLDDLRAMRLNAQRQGNPIDVRFVANADGECWIATGDVSYDTVHGYACEADTVDGEASDDDLHTMATNLVTGVADQLAEGH